WEVGGVGGVGGGERVPVEVVERNALVLAEELPRERRRDDPGTAGDEDALSLQRHAAESSLGLVDDFVQRAWQLVLRRDPDADAAGRLERGEGSRARLIRELVESREFERVELLDDGLARALAERLKQGRPRELLAPAWADERAIEIPWALARYAGERRVLDVGYAFAEPAYLEGLTALAAEELVGVDLAQKAVPGLRSVVADVRSLPLDDGAFGLAYCISTLEHVGRDNARYDVAADRDDDGALAALRRPRRA